MAENWYDEIKVDTQKRKLPILTTRQQVAESARLLSQTAIARLESGTGNPTLDLVERVADALECDLMMMWRDR